MPEVSPQALAPVQEVHSPSAFHRLIADARTPLFRNAIALIVNTAGTAATGVVYWILAARLYEPAQVGRGSAIIAAMLLLAGVGELNLVGALIRFIPRAGAETGRLITAAYRASAVTGLLIAGAFGFGWSQLMEPDRVLYLSLPLALWFAVAVVSMSIFALQDGVLTGLRQAKWVPLENALFGVVKIGLLIVLALWSVDVGVFLSWSIPVALTIAPVNLFIFRRLLPRHVAATAPRGVSVERAEIRRFVAGDFTGQLCAQAGYAVPLLMVTAMLGEVTNAYFSVVWIMVHTIDLLAVNISASLTVESAIEEQRLAEYARAVARRGFVLFSVLTVGIVLAAPWLLAAFGPEYATQGAVLLRLLAFAIPLKAVAELYAGICRVRRQTGRIAIVKAIQCLLLIALSAPLIDHLGATGVAWAALITHGALCFAVSPAVRRALSARAQSEVVAP